MEQGERWSDGVLFRGQRRGSRQQHCHNPVILPGFDTGVLRDMTLFGACWAVTLIGGQGHWVWGQDGKIAMFLGTY